MDHKTRGIILHTIKYSESSVIAKIYTEKFGLLSFLVKGVRASKSKNKASMMQPLTLLDMEISYRETRGLQYIKEYSRAYNYTSVPFDTLKSAIAMLLLEVITKSIREHEPNDEMFEFVYESFVALDVDAHLNPDFHLLFLLSFARFLGFAPHNNYGEGNRYFEMQEGFFVISGFLVAKSYTNTPSLKEYFIKRAKRILPAYVFVILFATILFSIFSNYGFYSYFTSISTYQYVAWNLVFLNFVHPCLPGIFENNLLCAVNGALWTLKIEEGFYLILPLVFYLITKFKKPFFILFLIYIASLVYWYIMNF